MLLSSNSNVHSMSITKSSIRPDALQVANIRRGMDVGMLLSGVPLVVITRALNIYPLAFLVNKGMLSWYTFIPYVYGIPLYHMYMVYLW